LLYDFEQWAEQTHFHRGTIEGKHLLEGFVQGFGAGFDCDVVDDGRVGQGHDVSLLEPGTPLHELAVFDGSGGFGRAQEEFALQGW
jgi:hypothetical protein